MIGAEPSSTAATPPPGVWSRLVTMFGAPELGWGSLRRLPPLLFLGSFVLWFLAAKGWGLSLEQMRTWTPLAGSLGMFIQGFCMIRSALRAAYVCQHADFGSEAARQKARWAVLPVLNIAVGVVIFSVIYYFKGADVAAAGANTIIAHLFWILTTAGLMIAILTGEMIQRMVEWIESEAAVSGSSGAAG